ncbi:MAG: leucine-rich repeat domain-containing protein, partial [Ruminococcus sp.]|nr:leucine-rich repeat domain-containing protein [Ruminococcus sp.]
KGDNMGEINPSTRQEIFLKGVADAMSGETASTITPSSREEMFLQNIIDAASGDEASYDLTPATREEYFLDKIADAASGGGGGGDIKVESLSVVTNATYTAPTGKAYSPVTVNVPNTYVAGDEGKVVSNGTLVSQSSATYTSNNTYDTTLIDSVTVNVSGGGGDITVESLSVTQNGTYTAPTGKAYSPISVNVSGGGGVEQKQINFIDYDGTILHSYTKAEINAMTQESDLPSNPSHTGLTAQGWNWTLAQIKAQLTAMPDAPVWVGQMYVTQSGDTEIDVVMKAGELEPYLAIAVNGSVEVDWGDNTTADTMTGTSLSTVEYQGHSYATAGNYTIKIHVVNGGFAFYDSSGSYPSVLRISAENTPSRKYSNDITAVRLGNNVKISNYAFNNCYALTSITIPSEVTSIGTSAFNNCYALTSITIPSEVTSIGTYAFNYCYALTSITIPSGVTSISNSAFYGCYTSTSITIPSGVTSIDGSAFYSCCALTSIIIPSGVTSIAFQAFYNCYSMDAYYFLPTTPPTLANTNAFGNIQSYTKIYVPYSADHSVLATYQTAQNWSTYASYMVEMPA